MFHKILKSGCKVEESRLTTAQRPTDVTAVFCILSWQVFWMTMLNRSMTDAAATVALTEVETAALDKFVRDRNSRRRKTLEHHLIKIARLAGCLGPANDPPPRNMVMWRGLSRLADIALGDTVGAGLVGD